MSKLSSAAQAVREIRDGAWVLVGGSGGGHGVPEALIAALAERFQGEGRPRDLTLLSVVSIGDWAEAGFNRLALPGLVRRVITGGLNNCPRLAALAASGQIEAYLLPQGVLSQLCREMAAGRPGLLTTVGLQTFVDPRFSGGRQNEGSREELVRLVEVDGRELLFYRSLPVEVALIRGTTADENGNLSAEEEAYFGENLSIAAAVHRRGGLVVAQAARTAAAGSIPGKEVKVPGILVDRVVEAPDQCQTYQQRMHPGYAGLIRQPAAAIPRLPLDIRKVMARRAAMELRPGDVVNLGFGVSNGIAPVAVEEGFLGDTTLTVEQGIVGGAPAMGKDAGAGVNFEAMVDQPYQFDFYDGGGLDIAFLSFAQVDRAGNVNVSRFGGTVAGPGGFINISQGTPVVVFSGTLTTGGLEVVPDGKGGVELRREGTVQKFVPEVEQVTFSGSYARKRAQRVLYVTGRAVLLLTAEGLELIEVAAGVSLERDVLGKIGFPVRVAPDLRTMDPRLFRPEPMGLAVEFRRREPRRREAGPARAPSGGAPLSQPGGEERP